MAPPVRDAEALRMIEDDHERARQLAQSQAKLLVVDVWAPWCAPCLAFRAEVLSRPELAAHQANFVFSSIDVDRDVNAAFLAQVGSRPLPTLLVVDPTTSDVIFARSGSMTFVELDELLATSKAVKGELATKEGYRELIEGHRARAAGNKRDAARLLSRAADALDGVAKTEATLAAIDVLVELDDTAQCISVAKQALEHVNVGSAPRLVVLRMIRCARRLPNQEPSRIEAYAAAEAGLTRILAVSDPNVTLHERAETLELYEEVLNERGAHEEARAASEERLSLLEKAASLARDSEHAQAFDHARVKLYLRLHREDDAISLLRKRTAERPDHYETHARLGSTLLELGHASEAVDVLEVAVRLAYGPPKLVYQSRLAAALIQAGDCQRAKTVIESELAGWRALPTSQRVAHREADAAARLQSLSTACGK